MNTESEASTPETSRAATPVPGSSRSHSIVSLPSNLGDAISGIPPFLTFDPWFDESCLIKVTLDEQVPLRIANPFCSQLHAKYSVFLDSPVIASKVVSKMKAICYYLCAIQLYNTMSDELKTQLPQGDALFNANLQAPRLMIKAISMLGNFQTPHGKVEVVKIVAMARKWVLLGLDIDPDVCHKVNFTTLQVTQIKQGLSDPSQKFGFHSSSYSQSVPSYQEQRVETTYLTCFTPTSGQPTPVFEDVIKNSLEEYKINYLPRLEKVFIMACNDSRSEGNAAQLVCRNDLQRFGTTLSLTQSELFLGSLFYPSISIETSVLDFKSSGDSEFSALKFAHADVKESTE